MLLLKRKGESIDDGAKNLEQLGDPVVPLCLVDELEEDVVDRSPNKGAEIQEFAVDPVSSRFEKVTFPRVFAVEEFKQLEGKGLLCGFKGIIMRLLTWRTKP